MQREAIGLRRSAYTVEAVGAKSDEYPEDGVVDKYTAVLCIYYTHQATHQFHLQAKTLLWQRALHRYITAHATKLQQKDLI